MRPKLPMTLQRQNGSMLVMSVFIMVVVLLLALSLTRILANSSQTVVYEVYGLRAYNAAQSGIEYGLLQLFPVSGDSATCADTSVEFGNLEGLQGCKFDLGCVLTTHNYNAKVIDYYQLTVTGQCTVGEVLVSRTLKVDAKAE